MTQEKKLTIEAADIEDALKEAAIKLSRPKEELKAEIISTERGGFLGLFGSKKLTVEITYFEQEPEQDSDSELEDEQEFESAQESESVSNLMLNGVEFVNQTLKLMDFNAEAVISEEVKHTIEITGDDAADYVVGRYGDALKSLEYLVNLALRDPRREPRIKVDSSGYRERRIKSLERLAEATARQALKFGRPVRLEPMASWERWVIHTTLKDRDDVTTESIGEPPLRKVVVMPKYDAKPDIPPGPATMRIRAQRNRAAQNNNRSRRFSK
ncbi:MAG: Jag N-terminal domain-containing protein [Synergistaceae bacterium]|nr:Jag N-terminal domain-containing protein [Synergistaceae bacterium]